jgi:hypothetical protein
VLTDYRPHVGPQCRQFGESCPLKPVDGFSHGLGGQDLESDFAFDRQIGQRPAAV